MMNITIFQINRKRDKKRIAFLAYESLPRFQGCQSINCKIYDKVFEGDVNCEDLEEIYLKFNLKLPKNYAGRSLSVSDIVKVANSNTVAPGFYFCDSIGFKEVVFNEKFCSETIQDNF